MIWIQYVLGKIIRKLINYFNVLIEILNFTYSLLV